MRALSKTPPSEGAEATDLDGVKQVASALVSGVLLQVLAPVEEADNDLRADVREPGMLDVTMAEMEPNSVELSASCAVLESSRSGERTRDSGLGVRSLGSGSGGWGSGHWDIHRAACRSMLMTSVAGSGAQPGSRTGQPSVAVAQNASLAQATCELGRFLMSHRCCCTWNGT